MWCIRTRPHGDEVRVKNDGQRKTSDERVCGDSLDDCPMTVVGECDDACATAGPYGSFGDCSDKGRARRGTVYHESITVYIPKQMM